MKLNELAPAPGARHARKPRAGGHHLGDQLRREERDLPPTGPAPSGRLLPPTVQVIDVPEIQHPHAVVIRGPDGAEIGRGLVAFKLQHFTRISCSPFPIAVAQMAIR